MKTLAQGVSQVRPHFSPLMSCCFVIHIYMYIYIYILFIIFTRYKTDPQTWCSFGETQKGAEVWRKGEVLHPKSGFLKGPCCWSRESRRWRGGGGTKKGWGGLNPLCYYVIWCGASSISMRKVSMGVSPMSLKKNKCSRHFRPMERSAGNRSNSLANLPQHKPDHN